ncbi:MAG: sulfite exporter TauE/SafE family protein [Clostridia bacterium]
MSVIWLIVGGFFGGIAGGMGMGGGTLLIPILTLLLSVPQTQAQGINLLSFIPMAIVTLIIHFKNKLVETKGILFIIIPACVVGVLSSILVQGIDTALLRKGFGVFLGVLGVAQLIMQIVKDVQSKRSPLKK